MRYTHTPMLLTLRTMLILTTVLLLDGPARAVEFVVGVTSTLTGAVPAEEIFPDVPIDAIPPLDFPAFVGAVGADLADDDLVTGVALDGDAFAYPFKIMNYHEIVRHFVGGQEVIATYCPLTASSVLFAANNIVFGNSGALYNNNVVMFDRETRSIWSQMALGSIYGERAGEHLQVMPVAQGTWAAWKALYPNTQVLSFRTGYEDTRNYNYDPWVSSGYTENEDVWFPQRPALDDRLPLKEMVYGRSGSDGSLVYPYSELRRYIAINDHFEETALAIFFSPAGSLALGYSRVLADGRELHFDPVENTIGDLAPQFVDSETGSTWTMLGAAIDGPLKGQQLLQIATYSSYWFAWSSFWQDSQIWDGLSEVGTAIHGSPWGQIKADRLPAVDR